MTRIIWAGSIAALLAVAPLAAQKPDAAETLLQTAIKQEVVDGNLAGAIEGYKKALAVAKGNRFIAAQALVHMAECYQKLGDAQSRKIYEQIVRDYGDQKEAVALARVHLAGSSAQPSGQTARQIWTGPGADTSVSLDGRYLSFTDWTTGDVAIRDLATGSNRRLTHDGRAALSSGFSDDSVISPDSRQVAYNWWDAAGRYELRVVAIAAQEGVRPRTVYTSDESYVEPLAWTPDSNQLLMLRTLKDGTSQLAMLPLKDSAKGDQSTVHVLKSLGRWESAASLSPDGRTIAYDTPDGGISLLVVDGSLETPLDSKNLEDSSPLWTPDGSHVVFLSGRSGTTSLWMIPVEGGRATGPAELLKTNVGSMSPMGIIKSGALYYSSSEVRRNISVAQLDTALKVTKPPTPASERFLNSNGRGAWSRDGRYLAYFSFRGARSNPKSRATLVIRTVATGKEQDLALDFRGYEHSFAAPPRWFPDGRSVLVVGDRPRQPGVGYYRVDLSSGKAELLLYTKKEGISALEPELSPDGKTIFFYTHDDGPEKLMRFDIENRRETELRQAEAMVSIAVSPDGTQLAYLHKGSIEVMPAAGGEPRTVYRAPGGTSPQSTVTWMPDQRNLLFVQSSGMGAQDTHVLWRVPLDGSAPDQVGISRTGGYPFTVQVHPDGHQIAFEWREAADTEIWALENFLPKVTTKK